MAGWKDRRLSKKDKAKTMSKKTRWRPALGAALGAGLGVLYAAGPRARLDHQRNTVQLGEDLEAALAQSEAQVPDIIPNTEKKIIWAHPEKTKTALAIVYLHGFSATRQETAPLCEQLAAALGANLFCTRLAGHGLAKDSMAHCTASDWLNDTLEAIQIGARLGEKMIVIGVSTGGTLAAWLATQPEDRDVLAYILISPNFAPKTPISETLTWPWAQQIVPQLFGTEYGWKDKPATPEIDLYWTQHYPTRVLFQMMALVKHVRTARLEQITKPVMFIYSPLDLVVNAKQTERQIARFGSPVKEVMRIEEQVNQRNHVLAGDIMAAGQTASIRDAILTFLDKVR
jgi:esterase/lipase